MPGMVVHAYNSNTGKVEAAGLGVQGQSQLQSLRANEAPHEPVGNKEHSSQKSARQQATTK